MSATDREWLREMFEGPARDLSELPEWARPVVTPAAGSPGTYGPTPPRHPWAPLPLEPGARARCTHCTQPRHEHEETRTR